MGSYRIRVATGAWLFSGSHNPVQLWLVGERGEAELELQLLPARGQVSQGSWDPDPGRGLQRDGGEQQRQRALWHFQGGGAQQPKRAESQRQSPGGAQPHSLSPTRGPCSLHYFPN